MLLTVASALSRLDEKPVGAVMMLDSRCVISSLEITSGNLLPFFQNRIAEIHENLKAVTKFCPAEPVHWVPSKLNPSDLLTRGDINLRDLGPSSFHQKVPEFLSSPWKDWPVTRDFVRTGIPDTEIRHRDLNFIVAAARANYCIADSSLGCSNSFKTVQRVADYSNSLRKVHRILARITRGWRGWEYYGIDLVITNPRALTLIFPEK